MSIFKIFRRSYVEWQVDEILAKGDARGEARTHRLWQEWNRRRMAAEAESRQFTEPPPSPTVGCGPKS